MKRIAVLGCLMLGVQGCAKKEEAPAPAVAAPSQEQASSEGGTPQVPAAKDGASSGGAKDWSQVMHVVDLASFKANPSKTYTRQDLHALLKKVIQECKVSATEEGVSFVDCQAYQDYAMLVTQHQTEGFDYFEELRQLGAQMVKGPSVTERVLGTLAAPSLQSTPAQDEAFFKAAEAEQDPVALVAFATAMATRFEESPVLSAWLTPKLKHADPRVKAQAARSLKTLQESRPFMGAEQVQALKPLLQEAHPKVVAAACGALAASQEEEVVALLDGHLEDGKLLSRPEGPECLAALSTMWFSVWKQDFRPQPKAWLMTLKHLPSLGKATQEDATQPLRALMREPKDFEDLQAQHNDWFSGPILSKQLGDLVRHREHNREVRLAAVKVLGLLKDKALLDALAAMFQDDADLVQAISDAKL